MPRRKEDPSSDDEADQMIRRVENLRKGLAALRKRREQRRRAILAKFTKKDNEIKSRSEKEISTYRRKFLEGSEQKATRWVAACEKVVELEDKIQQMNEELFRRNKEISTHIEGFFKSLQGRAQPLLPHPIDNAHVARK